jgi:hypothetical protein
MFGCRTLAALLRIEALLRTIANQEKLAMATLADIQAEVTAERTIDEGLLVLINQLIAAKDDPAALDAILQGMKDNIAPLSAALTANTPAATEASKPFHL